MSKNPKRVNLTNARKQLNLSRVEAAELIGCSTSALTNLENGYMNPSANTMSLVCEFYNLDSFKLFPEL